MPTEIHDVHEGWIVGELGKMLLAGFLTPIEWDICNGGQVRLTKVITYAEIRRWA
jgi:hypothetical protein